MQEKDVVTNEYFEQPERFADLVNGYVFGGKQVVSAQDVQEVNRVVIKSRRDGTRSGNSYVIRDVRCQIDIGIRIVLISLESQSDVHYAMPVRVMDADAAIYHRQWREKKQEHRKKKDLKGAEFLSGFAKEDKLIPTVTLVLYFGKEPWDGPRGLKDMMDLSDVPEDLKKLIADYPMQLLEIRKLPKPEIFQSDIRYVFGFLKYTEDKQQLTEYVEKHKAAFSELDEQAFDMISCMSKSAELKTIKKKHQKEKGGRVNMCQAITEMIADGEKRGFKRGEESGYKRGEESGYKRGEENGYKRGEENGYKRGEENGYKRGEENGYKRGEECFIQLTQHLIEEGKTDVLRRVSTDRVYRNQMYRKYRIQ